MKRQVLKDYLTDAYIRGARSKDPTLVGEEKYHELQDEAELYAEKQIKWYSSTFIEDL